MVDALSSEQTSRNSESSDRDHSESAGHGTLSHTESGLDNTDRSSDSSFLNTREDTSSHQGDSSDQAPEDQDGENGGAVRCTRKWILDFFKKNWKQYYRTFELNEKLYFHYKGFERIENMDLFPELKCLYWEGNGVQRIRGLETNTQLIALYL